MTSKVSQIRQFLRTYYQSDLEFRFDREFFRAVGSEFDRSTNRIYEIAKEVRQDLNTKNEQPSHHNTSQPSERPYEVSVVLSDLHYPYHLEPALRNIYELLSDMKPDNLILNGDFLDCYSISSYERDPRKPLLSDEITGVRSIFAKFREILPDSTIHFIEGNHEERLSRLISRNPGLYGLTALTWPHLLDLDALDITYTGYKDHITLHDDIQVTHGHIARKHSAYSAKGHVLDDGYSTVLHGHTHRLGSYYLTGVTGVRRGYEIGGLYDREQADYIENANWQNGFAIVRNDQINLIQIDPSTGSFIGNNKQYGGGHYG